MKMKKIIALVLCAVLACFALASCAEDDIKDHANDELDRYKDWYKPEVAVRVNYDFYIISECGDTAEAETSKATVQALINQKLNEKYDTTLTIHHISAEDYATKINAVVGSQSTGSITDSVIDGGSIVLVAGKDMYDSLVEKNALADIRGYLNTNAYGKLNTQLTTSLLDSAKVTVDGTEKLFMIPNDHIVGEYSYTVIDRAVAENTFNFSAQSELHEMVIVNGTPNDIAKELVDAIAAYNALDENADKQIKVDDVIREVKGTYDDKAEWEGKKFICNISKYPEVTAEETFMAGFAILNPPTYADDLDSNPETANADFLTQRAMDVIYSINVDAEIRNLLQYGVEYTNYVIEEKEEINAKGEKITVKYACPIDEAGYKMNLLYTGDMFNAYYSDDDVWSVNGESYSWNYVFASNGDKQNSESVIEE